MISMQKLVVFAGIWVALGFGALLLVSPQLVSETTAVTSLIPNLLFRGNLHEVSPGRFYRAAEMDGVLLKQIVADHKIRSVVDLRLDKDERDSAGRVERDVAAEVGVEYKFFPLPGSRVPSREQVLELVKLFDSLPEPILVHCSSGTHRSGVVSAVWLMVKLGVPLDVAREQLSLKYGFVSIERKLKGLFQGYPTIDHLLAEFEVSGASRGLGFREWLEKSDPQLNGR